MICISLTGKNIDEIKTQLSLAEKEADMTELRLDFQEDLKYESLVSILEEIMTTKKKPMILTVRSKKEGGKFPNKYEDQIKLFLKAFELNMEYIDIELGWPSREYKLLNKKKGNTKIIASYHNFKKILSPYALRHTARKLSHTNADILKIACHTNSYSDNLTMLDLISVVEKKFKKKMIAIAMGEKGITSRVLQESMGGFITFCSISESNKSAPGQVTVKELNDIKEKLNLN